MCKTVNVISFSALCIFLFFFPLLLSAFGKDTHITLPQPLTTGNISVEEALLTRKSTRTYSKEYLLLSEISQLLWAAQGITRQDGKRTAPSAGALYPLELYIVAGQVHGLDPGVYRYHPQEHTLERVIHGNRQKELSAVALKQQSIQDGAAVLVVAGVYSRTARKYAKRAERYVHIETGHAAQNVFLQAMSLGLSTVVIGAFDDSGVKRVLRMQRNESPLLIMPLGRTW